VFSNTDLVGNFSVRFFVFNVIRTGVIALSPLKAIINFTPFLSFGYQIPNSDVIVLDSLRESSLHLDLDSRQTL